MKRRVLLSLALLASISLSALAGTTYCLTNSFGEQATLTISGSTVTGTIDYTQFGSTIWPCQGTYNRSTGQLHFVATNPNPDFCTFFANTVTFDYTRTGVNTGSGSFANDCGVSGALDASAFQGACGASRIALKNGEYGSTGSHKMNRTKIPVPPGIDFKKLAPEIALTVSPNPPVKNANISVKLDVASKIVVAVYDQSGNLVKTIASELAKEGSTTYSWNLQSQNGTKVKTGYYNVKVNGAYDEKSVKIFVTE